MVAVKKKSGGNTKVIKIHFHMLVDNIIAKKKEEVNIMVTLEEKLGFLLNVIRGKSSNCC